MATASPSDEALLAFCQSHPNFPDRLASIVGAVGNLGGDRGEADAAEERLVEAAEREVRGQARMHRQGRRLCRNTKFGEIAVLALLIHGLY